MDNDWRMPFGKYEGARIAELPDGYLEWLAEQPWLRDPLRRRVAAELRARETPPAPPTTSTPPADIAADVADIVRTGFRRLAHARHPDHGGDTAAMAALNRAADWLRGLTGGAA